MQVLRTTKRMVDVTLRIDAGRALDGAHVCEVCLTQALIASAVDRAIRLHGIEDKSGARRWVQALVDSRVNHAIREAEDADMVLRASEPPFWDEVEPFDDG